MPTFPAVPALPVDGIDLNFAGIGASEASVTLSGTVGLGTIPFVFTDATGNPDAFSNVGGALGANYTADTITVSRGPSSVPGEVPTFGALSVALNVQVADSSGALTQPTSAIPITFHAQIQTLSGLTDAYYTVNSSVAGYELITLPSAWSAGLVTLSWSVSSALAFVESQDLVVVPNHRPVASDFSTSMSALGGPQTFHLTATDPDGQPIQFEAAPGTSLPAGVILGPDGTLTITPQASDQNLAPGQSRVVTFQYEATDGAQLSGPGQVVSYTIPGTPGTGGGPPPALGVGSGTAAGFGLGDAYNYALIDFSGDGLMALIGSPINGNVGVGNTALGVLLWGDTITGNLVTTGAAPRFTLGKVTGSTTGGSTQLAADIAALTTLSAQLAKEKGANIDFTKTSSIKDTAGTADGHGNYVFNVTKWSDNITISGGANDHVVLNVAKGVDIDLGNLTLTGGLTANNVLINVANGNTVWSADSDHDDFWGQLGHCGSRSVSDPVFNGTILAPKSDIQIVDKITINGHVFGSQDDFNILGGATINGATAPGGTGGTPPRTITETVALNATPATVSITINGPTLGQTLLGNSHQQTLTGGASAQWIIGGTAGDILVAGTGADTMIAGSTGSTLIGGPAASLLIGAAGGDVLQAGTGAETMVGGSYGFAAGTVVPGLSTLPTEPGITWNATATGPTGHLPATGDTFQFELGNVAGQTTFFGNTVVLEFDPAHDVLQISPFLYTQASDLNVQQVGSDTVISVSHVEVDGSHNVSTITLVGISASALTATNLVAG